MKAQLFICILILCFTGKHSLAQKNSASKQDSIRTEQLLKKALQEVYNSPEKSKEEVSKNLNKLKLSPYLRSKSYNHIGIAFDVMGKNDSALFYYNSALRIAKDHNLNGMLAGIHNNIGLIYWKQGDFKKAIRYYDLGLESYTNLSDTLGIANTLNNMGLIYQKMKDYTMSLESFRKAISNYKILNDKRGLSAAYANIAAIKDLTNQIDSSRVYFRKSIKLKTEIKDNYGLALVLSDYAKTFNKIRNCDSALVYDRKALMLFKEFDNTYHIAQVYYDMGLEFLCLNKLDSAEQYLLRAEKLASKDRNYVTLKDVNAQLCELYEQQGKWQLAYKASVAFNTYKDSLYTDDLAEAVFDVQQKYEVEKKNKEIAQKTLQVANQNEELARSELEISRKNFWLLILVFGVAASGAIIFLIRKQARNRRIKLVQEREIQEKAEKLRISKELHDNIGARLSHIISSLDIEIHRNELKNEVVEINAFARETMYELRETIWAVSDKEIYLSELVRRIENYVQQITRICKIQFEFEEKFTINPTLSSSQTINIFRIVQEAVNNSVKYARPQQISLKILEKTPSSLSFIVVDNGTGFNIDDSKQMGNGLENMHQRAQEINGVLEVHSNSIDGTTVLLTLDFN